jgi:hypothetical protein
MSCHLHKDAIVDLARGVALPAETARATQAHVDGCPECAAELRRQYDLTAALAELVSDARAWTSSRSLEQQLTGTFAKVHHTASPRLSTVRSRVVRWSLSMGAAASFALIAWASWPDRSMRVPEIAPPVPAVDRPDAKVLESPANVPAIEKVRNPGETRIAQRGRRRVAPPTVRPLEFMWIPGAAALPTFESGSIVHVELPVSALPAYGVQIVPDSVRSSIEADVLVGQDGQARGIRLISATEGAQRSRQ